MAGNTVEFSAKVLEEDYAVFKETFPQYGAVSWFINNALRSFNARVEANPEVKKLIDNSIQDFLDGLKNNTLTAR